MNIKYRLNSKLSDGYTSYNVLLHEKISEPEEYSTLELVVLVKLYNHTIDESDLLLKDSEGNYFNNEHALTTFLETLQKLPDKIVKRFFIECKNLYIYGNLDKAHLDNRCGMNKDSRTLTISRECLYNDIWLLDAIMMFLLELRPKLIIRGALDKSISLGSSANDSVTKTVSYKSRLKDLISSTKADFCNSDDCKNAFYKLKEYCTTIRKDIKNCESKPWLYTPHTFTDDVLQLFVVYITIKEHELLYYEVSSYPGFKEAFEVLSKAYKYFDYLFK